MTFSDCGAMLPAAVLLEIQAFVLHSPAIVERPCFVVEAEPPAIMVTGSTL
jgi:hypothetical protein